MIFIPPSPDIAYCHTLISWWENGFTEEEIELICAMGERQPPQIAKIGGSNESENKEIRSTLISWIPPEGWVLDKLGYIVNQLNGKYFGLDLWGFGESFQYSVYKYNKNNTNDHYNWHMDQGSITGPPRKLSLILQLSDPSDYDGGELEFLTGNKPEKAIKRKGLIYAFPSYVLHRVTPVTKGIRRSLVTWISGPRFK